MFVDWALASLHHLAIFTLAATLAAELAILTLAVDAKAIARLARIDMFYGLSAGVVVVVGIARVIWGAKGYEYYVANHIFWTKMVLFLIVGLLSIGPTVRYLAWVRQLRADAAFRAGDIGLEAATVVCSSIDALPGGVPAALNTEIEVLLVDIARDEGTRAVVQRSMEIADRFDPDEFERQEDRRVPPAHHPDPARRAR